MSCSVALSVLFMTASVHISRRSSSTSLSASISAAFTIPMSMPELLAASVKKTAWMLSRMTFAPLNPKLRFETPPLILHQGQISLMVLHASMKSTPYALCSSMPASIYRMYMYVYGAVPRARRAPPWSRGLGL